MRIKKLIHKLEKFKDLGTETIPINNLREKLNEKYVRALQ